MLKNTKDPDKTLPSVAYQIGLSSLERPGPKVIYSGII